MGIKLQIIPLVFAIVLFQHVRKTSQSEVPGYTAELIDNIEDFTKNGWKSDVLGSAKTGADLPGELAGKLTGKGIIYLNGSNLPTHAIRKTGSAEISPTFLYVEYYTYLKDGKVADGNGNIKQAYASPAVNPDAYDNRNLGNTEGFVWNDATLIQLDAAKAAGTPGTPGTIEIGMTFLEPGDYLLLNRIAVIRGKVLTTPEIQSLFASEEDTTTTTVTDPALPSTITTKEPATTISPGEPLTNKPSNTRIFKTWEIIVFFVLPALVLLIVILVSLNYWRKRRNSLNRFY